MPTDRVRGLKADGSSPAMTMESSNSCAKFLGLRLDLQAAGRFGEEGRPQLCLLPGRALYRRMPEKRRSEPVGVRRQITLDKVDKFMQPAFQHLLDRAGAENRPQLVKPFRHIVAAAQ